MSAIGRPQGPGQLPQDRQAPLAPDDDAARAGLAEYVDFDIEEPENVINDDGSMTVFLGDAVEAPAAEDGEFYANLAEVIPMTALQAITTDLMQKIEQDIEARKKRVEQYAEGIKRTGLGKDAPGGADFEGASRAVHPGLTEACIDYQSRIMKELWPSNGPVKPKINGTVTKEKSARAKRKVEYMNWQLTELMKEARTVTEKTLSQVPLGGSQFIKLWWNHRGRKPEMAFVSIDKIALPASASSYHSAKRRTFIDTLTAVEIQERIDSGVYADIELGRTAMVPETNKAEQATAKVEGVDAEPAMNIDDERQIYETTVLLEVTQDMADVLAHEEEGALYPYLLTIDVQTKQVLGFYRDWEEGDETCEPIEHLFEFPFITWDGAFAIGLPGIIGSLNGAATGALRALLDSAHIANAQGGFILKGSGTSGQSKTPQVTEFAEVDGNMATDDIRKLVMPFNTKEPSTVLFQLLGFLVEAQRQAVRTSMDDSAIDLNANTPVGTQLSRVEEGLVVFSAIHERAHTAFNRLLSGLHRLNRLYLPEDIRVDAAGKEIMVRRRDFEGPADIQPVSNPTIYSDQQRMGQINAVQMRAAAVPGLYNQVKVEERFLGLMKMADPDELLNKPPQPTELNAVNENLAMTLGRPVVAFPEQDHLAHLQVHLDFASSPVLGANPIIGPKFTPAFLQHCAEHFIYHYVKAMNDLVSYAAGVEADELMSSDPDVKDAFDKLLGLASQHVTPTMQEDFEGAMPVIMQAVQRMQAMMPQQPIDPAQAALMASKMETERKAAEGERKGALEEQRNALQAQRNDIQREGNELRARTDLVRTAMQAKGAQQIASMRIQNGRPPGYSTGSSFGGG